MTALTNRPRFRVTAPAACAALTVPHVFLLYNESALFQAGVAAVFALVGNLAGAIRRRLREGARCEEQ